jgi:hypothetical protein
LASEETSGSEELRPSAFVEALLPDPSQPAPRTRVLGGLLGNSPKDGYWRLYLTSELDDYVEFAEEDVLHSEPMPKEQPPVVPTRSSWAKLCGSRFRSPAYCTRKVVPPQPVLRLRREACS